MNSCTIHVVNGQKIVLDLRYHNPLIWLVVEETAKEAVVEQKEEIVLLRLKRNGPPKPGQMISAFEKELFVFARGRHANWTNGFPSETVEEAISEAVGSWYTSAPTPDELVGVIRTQLEKFV